MTCGLPATKNRQGIMSHGAGAVWQPMRGDVPTRRSGTGSPGSIQISIRAGRVVVPEVDRESLREPRGAGGDVAHLGQMLQRPATPRPALASCARFLDRLGCADQDGGRAPLGSATAFST